MCKTRIKLIATLIFGLVLSSCHSEKRNEISSGTNNISITLKLDKARIFVTAKDNKVQLSETESVAFTEFNQPDEFFPTIMVDPNKQFQIIEGFGGALTDASAETFYKLPADKQKEIIQSYFNPTNGIGYTLCRTHINSCDFSSDVYAYSEVEGDTGLKNFTIEHDRKFRIPLIKEAMKESGDKLVFFVSPWSPPAWMKTSNNMLQGGNLKPEYMQAWANYYVRFIQEYEKEGIPVWGLSVQNEPMATQTWESCLYSAEEERDFIKNNLGPALHTAGFAGKKLLIWDHNRGIMYQRAKAVLDDSVASKYVWGVGFHWYTGNHFDNVRLVKEAYPDKNVMFTEGCVFPFDYNKITEWHWGETYGESILKDLNNGASGWIDWNILLDETGGPNHVSNFCYAPVIGNTKTGEVIYMSSFYYLGHFSKFIRPGARRIISSSNDDNLLATAMINPDNSVVVVALNLTDKEFDYKIWIEGKGITAKCPSHSISTILIN